MSMLLAASTWISFSLVTSIHIAKPFWERYAHLPGVRLRTQRCQSHSSRWSNDKLVVRGCGIPPLRDQQPWMPIGRVSCIHQPRQWMNDTCIITYLSLLTCSMHDYTLNADFLPEGQQNCGWKCHYTYGSFQYTFRHDPLRIWWNLVFRWGLWSHTS